MISIELQNSDELMDWLRKASDETKLGVKQLIVESALSLSNQAKRDIQGGNKSGNEYVTKYSQITGKRYRVYTAKNPSVKGKVKVASAVGEAPQTDTGALVNSIQALPKQGLNAEVVATTNYSFKLETELDRPIFKKNLEKELPKLFNKIEELLGKIYE